VRKLPVLVVTAIAMAHSVWTLVKSKAGFFEDGGFAASGPAWHGRHGVPWNP
jgi:hypothetical protein